MESPLFWNICLIIGIVELILATKLSIQLILQYLVYKWVPNDLYGKYGKVNAQGQRISWALVTGASDGIGLGMCKVLAREYGFNILMVSRNINKLENAKKQVLEHL